MYCSAGHVTPGAITVRLTVVHKPFPKQPKTLSQNVDKSDVLQFEVEQSAST